MKTILLGENDTHTQLERRAGETESDVENEKEEQTDRNGHKH